MNKKKSLTIFMCIFIIASLFSGCLEGSSQTVTENEITTKSGDYILTTDTGKITMFDSSGQTISEIDLGKGTGNYIYIMDNGNIYSSNLNVETMPQILWALDKSSRKLTAVLNYKDTLRSMKDYIIREGNVEDIYAYNGLFFYSTNNPNTKANQYTYVRPQTLGIDGKLSYAHSVPTNISSTSTYIYMENYTNDYLTFIGLKEKLSAVDIQLMNIPEPTSEIYEIPGTVASWTANNRIIYFFNDFIMGQYEMESNQIQLHYGPINSVGTKYIDGINKRIYNISDFGEESNKSLLLSIDYDKMKVDKGIEIKYNNPMAIHVDKSSNIYVVFKSKYAGKNHSQIRVFRYGDYAALHTTSVPYLPTKILSKGDHIYLFNPFEDHFYAGAINSSELTNVSKNEFRYTDIFLTNIQYINDYIYDEHGRLVNRENVLIDSDGNMINEYGDRINMYGQRIDENNRAINKDGEFIDKYNNIINTHGEIIRYTINSDGMYYNSKGQFVSETGIVLVRNDIGDWILPSELINEDGGLKITGHYDEKGNFIIDRDILEKYPDAYEIWNYQQLE